MRTASTNPQSRSRFLLVCIVGVTVLLTLHRGTGQARAGDKKPAPAPRLARVSPPEAVGAVEVSVAINPTNPDHMVAASIARVKEHPSITNFAFVTTD